MFSTGYSIYGSLTQGLLYGGALFPVLIIACVGIIYKAVPELLFVGHKQLFYLVALTIFIALLNYTLLLVYLFRVFLDDIVTLDIYVMQRDILYLIISTLLFSLPIIFYETLSQWEEQKRRSSELEQEMMNMEQKLDEVPTTKNETIQLRSDGKNYRIQIDEIRYVEGMGDYIQIHLKEGKLMTLMTLKELNKKVQSLIRVHRSYLVNPKYCYSYNRQKISLYDEEIPIGGTYQETVSNRFN